MHGFVRAASFLVFLPLILLAACGGRTADTNTKYELPGTPGARLCINQCRNAKDFCLKDCDLDRRQCTINMQSRAIKDYEAYAREQLSAKAPIELQPSDFERPELCMKSSCADRCEKSYRSCYEKCGGKVITSSSCSFLCF